MSKSVNKNPIVGIDLFSGAGGMSLGAIQAGIKVICAVENCPHASATYRLNFPDVQVLGDIRGLTELPRKPDGALSVLFGGPPCQGFSTSNQRTRNGANPNNWLFLEFLRMVKLWEPDWVVMENVKGIVETEGGRFLRAAIYELKDAGYTVDHQLLNAVNFGVPQRRTRAFIVGSRNGAKFAFPGPTSDRLFTVKDAIGDLPALENGARIDRLPYGVEEASAYARTLRNGMTTVTGNLVTRNAPHILERYEHVPPGGNWENIPVDQLCNYKDRTRCHTGIYRRLDPAEPSVVIGNYRKNMLVHPKENRGLSVREAARLQAIPDSFGFVGSIGFQQQQVGNMVPTPLAHALFRAISRAR